MRADLFVFDPIGPKRVLLTEDTDADDDERYALLVGYGDHVAVVTLPAEVVDELSFALRTATKRRRSSSGHASRTNPELAT